MKTRKRLLFSLAVAGLMMAAAVGCSGSPTQEVVQERSVTAAASETAQPTATLSPTDTAATDASAPTSTPEPSLTPIPTDTSIPTPTKTPIPTPTWTPLPTIDPRQRGTLYSELMSDNAGCVLPCWWGFEMGVDRLDEIRQFYLAFDTFISEQTGPNGISALYATFVDPQIDAGRQVQHIFVAQDGIVIEAEIEIVFEPHYQIRPLLHRLGQPADIWMWTIPNTFDGALPGFLLLFFPQQGVLVSYGTGGVRVNDAVHFCFDELGGTIIRLWDPAIWDPAGVKGIVERVNDRGSFSHEGYRPIDEVSNWDVEQFYTVLTGPNSSECLQTPSNLWQSP